MKRESGSHEQSKEQHEQPKRVLKISEMAVFVDGEHVGESMNPSYGERESMYEYDVKGDLLISGHHGTALLNKNDLVKLPQDYGFISVERLLGDRTGQYSDKGMEIEIGKFFHRIRSKVDKISFLARELGVKFDINELDHAIKSIFSLNKQYSPEELIEFVLVEMEEEYVRHSSDKEKEEKIKGIIERLRKTEVLEKDPVKSRNGIVNYFYLYCEVAGIDASNTEEILKGFDDFLFLKELMDEYKRNSDGRFGDELLVACSQLEEKWKEEQ